MPRLTLLMCLLGSAARGEIGAAGVDFQTPGLEEHLGGVFAERFAVYLRGHGIAVTTQKDIAALLSVERQKQLLGCADTSSSCLAELAGALGVEAIITGQAGRLGKGIQLNVKVLHARTASMLFQLSRTVDSEAAVLEALSTAAPDAAARLKEAFDPTRASTPSAGSQRRGPLAPWLVVAAGAGALGAGLGVLGVSFATGSRASGPVQVGFTPTAIEALDREASQQRLAGILTAVAGITLLAVGIFWLWLGAD